MSDIDPELLQLYDRLVKLQKQRARVLTQIDNVRELIRQKG